MTTALALGYVVLIAVGLAVFKLYMLGLPNICQ